MVLIDALAEPAKLTKASGVVARSLEVERSGQNAAEKGRFQQWLKCADLRIFVEI